MTNGRVPAVASAALCTVVAVLAQGCGLVGGGAPDPADALAVGVPRGPARYIRADTAVISVSTGVIGDIEIRVDSEATLLLDFASVDGGLQVSVSYEALQGRVSNPMGAPALASTDGVSGSLDFSVDPRGRVSVATVPVMEPQDAILSNPLSFAHLELFPRLPGGATEPGSSWADTITIDGGQGGGSLSAIYDLTYTLRGDTVVEGRHLDRIDVTGTFTNTTAREQGDLDVKIQLQGEVSGYTLWDRRASLTAYGELSSTGAGTTSVPSMGMGNLRTSTRGTTRVTLQR